MSSEYALKRRLNFCIWTQTHKVWIGSDRWDSCKVETASTENAAMRVCAAGLDPSSTIDLTSLVVALRHDDPPEQAKQAEEVAIEGMNEAGDRVRIAFRLDFSVELVPFFWMPEQTLHERVRKERIPYDDWARKGLVFTTPGGAIDHNAIYDFVWKDAWKRFKIQRLGMDENHGRFLFMRLRDDAKLGENVVSVGQAKKLSEAYKFMEILIAHRRLRHNGHPVLTWCVSNAEPQTDRLGAVWIEKPKEDWKRIDGAVASAMAIHQLMALPAKRKSVAVFAI
jgi:phage terminase large subunit-like protein